MVPECGLSTGAIGAVEAVVRLFPRVGADVSGEVPGLYELPATVRA